MFLLETVSIELQFFFTLSLKKRVSIAKLWIPFLRLLRVKEIPIDVVLAILHLLGLYREYHLISKNLIRM